MTVRIGRVAGSLDSFGYIRICVRGKRYKAHRLAWLYMTGEWPPAEVDHRNRVKNDNRWNNLRLASATQQRANCNLRATNTTGAKNVRYRPKSRRWIVSMQVHGKRKWFGSYETKEQASQVAADKAQELYGEYSNV